MKTEHRKARKTERSQSLPSSKCQPARYSKRDPSLSYPTLVHADEDADQPEILNDQGPYGYAGCSNQHIAAGNSGAFTPTLQSTSAQAANYYAHTDEDADRLDILNNHGPYIHTGGSNQYFSAGSSGSFTPTPQTTSAQASNYCVQWPLEHSLVDTNENAGQAEFPDSYGLYINAGGSNQRGSFTPISQTPSVQASNYRVHRALEPNRTFTRPTPYPFELV